MTSGKGVRRIGFFKTVENANGFLHNLYSTGRAIAAIGIQTCGNHPGSRLSQMASSKRKTHTVKLFGCDRTRDISIKSAHEITEAARTWGQNDDITVVRKLSEC